MPARLRAWRDGLRDLLLQPVAGIVLVRGAALGALMWLALVGQPRLLLAGLAGIAVGEAVRRLIGMDDVAAQHGCLKANAFLAGVAAGWVAGPAGLGLGAQTGLVAGAAALAAVIAAAIRRALDGTTLLPLVWAYCIVAGLYFMLFPEWTFAAIAAMDWGPAPAGAAGWGLALLRSLGALMFTPTPWAGAIMAAVILAWSRLSFLFGLVGWGAGVVVAQGFLGLGEVYYWLPSSYNFFLSGMALGAVFYLPSRASFIVAAASGAFASVAAIGLQHLFAGSPAAYLPIPFGLAVWVGGAALVHAEQRGLIRRNPAPDLPPEDSWRAATLDLLRWGDREPLLGVPLAGAVEVTQGFSGALSHVGRWRHAIDLQRPGSEGARPSLWEEPVYAPAAGTVERLRADVPDNPLGEVNFQENWGNHLVIRLDQGGWAMVAHLRQGSLSLAPGARVLPGTFLGLAGNSGRSPTPHLHLQAQQGPDPAAATTRFRLANYLTAPAAGEGLTRWHAAGVPAEGTVLAAAVADPAVHALLVGMVPGRALWSVDTKGRVPGPFAADGHSGESIDIRLDEWGRHHHASTRLGGEMVSRADLDAWRVLSVAPDAGPFLHLLALAMPVVPYAAFPGMTWQERSVVPPPGQEGALARSLAPFRGDPFLLLSCRCLARPLATGGRLVIQAELPGGGAALPLAILAELEPTRGCVALAATFEEGSVTWSLLSFAPGLPLERPPT